jgi:hypothetical protein
MQSMTVIASYAFGVGVNIVTYNPNGTLLAIGGGTNHFDILDPLTLTLIIQITTTTVTTAGLDFRPDGVTLLVCG